VVPNLFLDFEVELCYSVSMIYEKEHRNGQLFVSGKHGGKKWVTINHLDQEVSVLHNPGAKELVYYKIEGYPSKDLEERFVVAYRADPDAGGIRWLNRLEVSFSNKNYAKAAAEALSCLYDEVFVLDTNYKAQPYNPTQEEDPEMWDRNNEG